VEGRSGNAADPAEDEAVAFVVLLLGDATRPFSPRSVMSLPRSSGNTTHAWLVGEPRDVPDFQRAIEVPEQRAVAVFAVQTAGDVHGFIRADMRGKTRCHVALRVLAGSSRFHGRHEDDPVNTSYKNYPDGWIGCGRRPFCPARRRCPGRRKRNDSHKARPGWPATWPREGSIACCQPVTS